MWTWSKVRESGGVILPQGIHWSEWVKRIQVKQLLNFTGVTYSCIPVTVGTAHLWPGWQAGLHKSRYANLQGYKCNLLLQNSEWVLSFTKTEQSRWTQIADFLDRSSCNPTIPSCLVNNNSIFCLLLVDLMLFYTSGSYNFPPINQLRLPATLFTGSISPLNQTLFCCAIS